MFGKLFGKKKDVREDEALNRTGIAGGQFS
jgi:hypothetical protein